MTIPDFLRTIRAGYGRGYLLMPAVAAVVRDRDGRLLIMRRADTGEWSLPSGICEPDEPPARTAVRELYEETGLIARPTRLLAVFHTPELYYPNGDRAGYVSTVFELERIGGELHCRDGEALELRYEALDRLPEIRVLDWMPAGLEELLAPGASGSSFSWDETWLDELRVDGAPDHDAGP